MVLVIARLLYAHRLLQDPGYTVEDVAVKLGYGRTRSLQDLFKEVFGLTAGEVRLSLTVEEALSVVTKRYFGGLNQAAS
jgi:AraC-like DNA-binding protein